MQVAASFPIAEAVTMIEVESVAMERALVVVEAAAGPSLEAVAADLEIVAVKPPAAAVARVGTDTAAFRETVKRTVAPAKQPSELHWPRALHAPYDHCGYASICRALPELLRL